MQIRVPYNAHDFHLKQMTLVDGSSSAAVAAFAPETQSEDNVVQRYLFSPQPGCSLAVPTNQPTSQSVSDISLIVRIRSLSLVPSE